MLGIASHGPMPLLCTLIFCSLQGCWGAVAVTVTPEVEGLRGGAVTLPCSFTVTPPSPTDAATTEWFIDEPGNRVRVAFRPQTGGEGGSDPNTKLSGRVSVGADSSLSISSLEVEDERSFHCQVTVGASGVGEGTTKLKVFNEPDKPEVKGVPEFITISEDSVTEIGQCVSKNGRPEPLLVWYQDASPLEEIKEVNDKMYMVSSVVQEVTGLFTMSSTLYLRVVKEDGKSSFHCRVEYALPGAPAQHKDSEPFSLPVFHPTEQVTFALVNPGPVKAGDAVQLKCEADGNPIPDYAFTFKKGGADTRKEAVDGILTLSPVTRDDAGVYRCEALDFDSSPEVELVKELTLEVHYLEVETAPPAGPVVAPLGGKVEVTCSAKASAEHALQWKKGSSVVSESGTLVLEKVDYADAGVYSCVATVPSVPGLQEQANVTLNVEGKPEIDDPSDGVVEKEGDTVTLTCSARGYPAPKFTWKPAGKEPTTVEEGSGVTSTVQVEATAAVLEGGATCEATNKHGADSKQLKVVIGKATDANTPSTDRTDKQEGGSGGVIAAVVVSLLLLLLLALLLFFLWKKEKLCWKKEKTGAGDEATNSGPAVEMEKGLLNQPAAAEQQ